MPLHLAKKIVTGIMSIKQFIAIYNKPRQPVQQNSFTVTSKPLLACHYCKAFLHKITIFQWLTTML